MTLYIDSKEKGNEGFSKGKNLQINATDSFNCSRFQLNLQHCNNQDKMTISNKKERSLHRGENKCSVPFIFPDYIYL